MIGTTLRNKSGDSEAPKPGPAELRDSGELQNNISRLVKPGTSKTTDQVKQIEIKWNLYRCRIYFSSTLSKIKNKIIGLLWHMIFYFTIIIIITYIKVIGLSGHKALIIIELKSVIGLHRHMAINNNFEYLIMKCILSQIDAEARALQDKFKQVIDSTGELDFDQFLDDLQGEVDLDVGVSSTTIKSKLADQTIIDASSDSLNDSVRASVAEISKVLVNSHIDGEADYILKRKNVCGAEKRRIKAMNKGAKDTGDNNKEKQNNKNKSNGNGGQKLTEGKRTDKRSRQEADLSGNNGSGNDGNDQGNNKPPNKQPKLTYREIVKAGKMICDVRASNGHTLGQHQFNRINNQSLYKIIEHKLTADQWNIKEKGINPHGLWYEVGNQATVDAFKKVVPEITPCDDEGNDTKDFKFVVYGPGESPVFFLKWRVSVAFKDTPIDVINTGLKIQNPEIQKVTGSNGEERDANIKVLRRHPERKRDAKLDDSGKGNISLLLQVEEALWETLIKVSKGKLNLGAGDGLLEGEGLLKQVQRYQRGEPIQARNAKDETEENDDEMEESDGLAATNHDYSA